MRRFCIILLCLCAVLKVYAQNASEGGFNVINGDCHSPEVQAVLRHGQIDVGHHTGTANIEIPLFKTSVHGLDINISALYNTSGIKVDDVASCLGLGWVLNAGGFISRTVNGIADETPQRGWLNNNLTDHELGLDYYRQNMYNTSSGNPIDCAADDFHYSFFGYNGSFVFRKDKKLYQLPFSNLKIEFVDQDYFIITDERGNKFFFTEKEKTIFGSNGTTCSTTAWHLSKIELINKGGEISFSYINGSSYEDRFPAYTSIVVERHSMSGSATYYNNFVNSISGTHISYSYIQTSTKWLKNINIIDGDLGHIEFEYYDDSRKDIGGAKSLKSIKVYNSKTSTKPMRDWLFVKKIVLCDKGRKNNIQYEYDKYRMFLYSIYDLADNVDCEAYTMEYDPTPLPCRKSFGKDLWGYYNGRYNNTNAIYVRNYDTEKVRRLKFPSDVNNNRKGDEQYMKAGSLTRINYSTGGYTQFEYEAHRISNNEVGGGLRIKSIKNFSDSTLVEARYFKYGKNEDGIGKISFFNYDKNFKHLEGGYHFPRTGNTDEAKYTIHALTDTPFYPSYVAYEQVCEYVGTPSGDLGKTEYDFLYTMDGLADNYNTYPHPMYFESHRWESGEPLEVRNYESYKGQFRLVRRESNRYSRFDLVRFGTYCVNINYQYSGNRSTVHDEYINNSHNKEEYFTTYIPKETGVLKKSVCTTTDFFYSNTSCDSIKNIVTYNYDGLADSVSMHDCVTGVLVTRNKTLLHKYVTHHLLDIAPLNDSLSLVYKKMLYLNMGTTVIEKREMLGEKTISAQVFTYQLSDNDIVVPKQIFNLEITNPIHDYKPFSVAKQEIDSRMNADISFTKFDAYGNISEYIERDSIKNVFIWGYKGVYPILEAKGISYNEISETLGKKYLSDTSINMSFNPQHVYSALSDKYRDKAIIFRTYSHIPIFGISSIYDTNGKVTSYIYDVKGRLLSVKDCNGATEKKIKYNLYKSYSKPCHVIISTMLNKDGTNSIDKINYYDGLGRSLQTVHRYIKDNTSIKKNMGYQQEYDLAGNNTKQWVVIPFENNEYLSTSAFKKAATEKYDDAMPYNETIYEASQLNRIIQQQGPGETWFKANRAITTQRLTNTDNNKETCCKHYVVDRSENLLYKENYAASTLDVIRITDEDNQVSYNFIDGLGHTVLTRKVDGKITVDTYFVYDSIGKLRYVLQPMFQIYPDIQKFAFIYKYDKQGLCIKKQIPGTDDILYTYDSRGRLAFSQNGNQGLLNKQNYYKYDNLGRLTEKGLCNISEPYNHEWHTRFYYDNYKFIGETDFASNIFEKDTSKMSHGLLTGTICAIYANKKIADKISYAFYYDQKGRKVKTISTNILDGFDETTVSYTFTDKVSRISHYHYTSKYKVTERKSFLYDYADRLINTAYLVNDKLVEEEEYTYDDFGRQSEKKVSPYKSCSQKYVYNIRNWLTEIKSDNFYQKILYENTSNARFGGDISSMIWSIRGDFCTKREYDISYDGLGRFNNAIYSDNHNMNFSVKIFDCDYNRNIHDLIRYGMVKSDTCDIIDDLHFHYNGNQIEKIEDICMNSAINGNTEFKDGANEEREYIYDNNGNLICDLNRNIKTIVYNDLDLPSKIVIGDTVTIFFVYSAEGEKMCFAYEKDNSLTIYHYCGNVIYKNETPIMLLTDNGYVTLNDNVYHHFVRDYQGNNRMVVTENDNIEEINNYYPFGGVFGSNVSVQPYKYNRKELCIFNNNHFYDYGARIYDAALCRFITLDPMSDSCYPTSPYIYCNDDPINNIDIDGKYGFKCVADFARNWYNLWHSEKAGPVIYNGDATNQKFKYTFNTYDYSNNEFTVTSHYKIEKKIAEGMQDVGDAIALVGYVTTLTVVFADKGIILSKIGNDISNYGDKLEFLIDFVNGDYDNLWKNAILNSLDYSSEIFMKKLPGFGSKYHDGSFNLGTEIIDQGRILKISGIKRIVDKKTEEKENSNKKTNKNSIEKEGKIYVDE